MAEKSEDPEKDINLVTQNSEDSKFSVNGKNQKGRIKNTSIMSVFEISEIICPAQPKELNVQQIYTNKSFVNQSSFKK